MISNIQAALGEKAEFYLAHTCKTISKDRLGKRLDHLSVADAARVRRLIVEMYGE